jgi:acetyl-CoA carboxylase, biotin carboxylase subunit
MFDKVLIINRGEIALRVIHACKKLGIRTVAAYSEADQSSPHLAFSDERVCIGPGPSAKSYLNQEAILQAAEEYQCQAIHPGYGFLSENALFAARCALHKISFIGPSPSALRLMGDKASARATMAQRGVIGVPGSDGIVQSVEDAISSATKVGYPVLLKATAGGGGKGMRICRTPEDLPRAFEQASMEARSAFGDPSLYMERFVEGGRHIEFQVLGDRYGHVIHLGERECSTQRNNQKVIEEAPSSGVTETQRSELGQRICTLLSEIGYVGAGTVELLRTPTGELFFMEMNTRLQVEHPVTEMVTGVDLVEWQIRIAAGEQLSIQQEDIVLSGHSIECRLNAEDPLQNFRPAPGEVSVFDAPEEWRYRHQGPIRLDSHVISGYKVPALYDSMLGKLIVRGTNRDEAIELMTNALDKLKIIGVPNTIELHQFLLHSAPFKSGQYSTADMSAVMEDFQTHFAPSQSEKEEEA